MVSRAVESRVGSNSLVTGVGVGKNVPTLIKPLSSNYPIIIFLFIAYLPVTK